jgi:hypothetical protein
MQAPPTRAQVEKIEMKAFRGDMSPGARNNPSAQVKITSMESLGLVKEMRSITDSNLILVNGLNAASRVVIASTFKKFFCPKFT